MNYKKWAWTSIDTVLSDTMSSYWINCAATGNPNGARMPAWPAYSERADTVMILGDAVEAKANPRKAGLEFVDTANVKQRAN